MWKDILRFWTCVQQIVDFLFAEHFIDTKQRLYSEEPSKILSKRAFKDPIQIPFIRLPDASSYAIRACLSQKEHEHLIVFILEKYTYAVIFALNKIEHYIYRTQVINMSEHRPLKFLTDNARIQRWTLVLQRFQIQMSLWTWKTPQ